jgi:alpha-galactosidase
MRDTDLFFIINCYDCQSLTNFSILTHFLYIQPMGFNTWNLYGCSVDAQILKDTALAMNQSGLQAAKYQFVNSDDCWMMKDRDTNGNQVPNPEKFPNGFKDVADYIHSLGLSSGLYTAKGPNTCAGFAASCQHEAQDALLWASWGIDYVKDDSCSDCRHDDDLDYHTMQLAIQASGRPMILSIEGGPSYANFTAGLLGNAHRVGHDITPEFNSMLSLVDIGSGLWSFAHNATLTPENGGVWNDLDMIEGKFKGRKKKKRKET